MDIKLIEKGIDSYCSVLETCDLSIPVGICESVRRSHRVTIIPQEGGTYTFMVSTLIV